MAFETGINETLSGGTATEPSPRRQSLSEIVVAEPVLTALLRQWSGVEFAVLENRKMRRQRVDLEALRAQGKLKADEKYIGVRVIDNNITKDIPPYIGYLKQSRRFAIFRPNNRTLVSDDLQQKVEDEYSRVMRYVGWEIPYIRWIDGTEMHGYDWAEVLYDDTKPGRVAVNHVGVIDLIFDLAVTDIQHSRVTMRRYKPTLVALDELAQKNGFDPDVVKRLRLKIRESLGSVATEAPDFHQDGTAVHLYKVMYKERGIVFSAWWCPLEPKIWLRKPKMFWNGIKTQETQMTIDPVMGMIPQQTWVRQPVTKYPYKLLRYRITEDATIAQSQGRGEMDLHIQEASCSLWSSFINMTRRSANVMWSPSQPDPTVGGTAPKQLNLIIKDGAIWDRPMTAFTAPEPNPMLPKALEMLSTQNADNINQPAWTVSNRQDSRKTATEVDAATQAQGSISSVNVVPLSIAMLEVHEEAWPIVRSQALQGNIEFLEECDPQQKQAALTANYTLSPAGDIDFIERNELTQKMQQDWPVYQNTPAAPVFLEEYTRVRYPAQADKFISAMRQGDIAKQLVASMGALLKTAVTEPSGALKPEWAPHAGQLQQIAQTAQQVMQQP